MRYPNGNIHASCKRNYINKKIKLKIPNEDASVKMSSINLLTDPNHQSKVKSLISEIDLDNKIKKFRTSLILEAEKKLKSNINFENNSRGFDNSIKEPLFAYEEYRLKKTEMKDSNLLYRAIKNKNIDALEEIKKSTISLHNI